MGRGVFDREKSKVVHKPCGRLIHPSGMWKHKLACDGKNRTVQSKAKELPTELITRKHRKVLWTLTLALDGGQSQIAAKINQKHASQILKTLATYIGGTD